MPFEGVRNAAPPRIAGGESPASGATRMPSARMPEKRLSAKAKAREEAANGFGQIVGFAAMAAGQFHDAGAIGMHWPGMAHEAAIVAETDEKMARALDYLLEVGPYGNLITLALPFVAQVLVNHGVLKPEAMAGAGVVHPDALTAQIKADMARKAMEALKMQQEAEEELARTRAEMMARMNGNGAAPE